jgi:hypothetical protein
MSSSPSPTPDHTNNSLLQHMESLIDVDKNETVNEGVEIVCVDDSSDDDADALGTPVWLCEMKLTGKFITVKECLSKKKYCGIANNTDL